jgi:hypothetical protein
MSDNQTQHNPPPGQPADQPTLGHPCQHEQTWDDLGIDDDYQACAQATDGQNTLVLTPSTRRGWRRSRARTDADTPQSSPATASVGRSGLIVVSATGTLLLCLAAMIALASRSQTRHARSTPTSGSAPCLQERKPKPHTHQPSVRRHADAQFRQPRRVAREHHRAPALVASQPPDEASSAPAQPTSTAPAPAPEPPPPVETHATTSAEAAPSENRTRDGGPFGP